MKEHYNIAILYNSDRSVKFVINKINIIDI